MIDKIEENEYEMFCDICNEYFMADVVPGKCIRAVIFEDNDSIKKAISTNFWHMNELTGDVICSKCMKTYYKVKSAISATQKEFYVEGQN